jgi:two-component system invasion response regulator UvrY
MAPADTLHISPKTVANLRTLIKNKLGVGSELVRLALRQGLLAQTEFGGA